MSDPSVRPDDVAPVKSILLTPSELRAAAALRRGDVPEAVWRLVAVGGPLMEPEADAEVLDRLRSRSLLQQSSTGELEFHDDLATALDCITSATLVALVMAETDTVRVTALLGAGGDLAAVSRESTGIGIRLLPARYLVATIAMLSGLRDAGPSADGSPVVVAELHRTGIDEERPAVPATFEEELERRVAGRPHGRSVVMTVHLEDGSIERSDVTWIVDEGHMVFEVRARGDVLEVVTSDPDLIVGRLHEVLRR